MLVNIRTRGLVFLCEKTHQTTCRIDEPRSISLKYPSSKSLPEMGVIKNDKNNCVDPIQLICEGENSLRLCL